MPIVNLYVRGGVVQGLTIPPGSNVVVRVVDYDCEGSECVDTDDKGDPCSVAIYEASEEEA